MPRRVTALVLLPGALSVLARLGTATAAAHLTIRRTARPHFLTRRPNAASRRVRAAHTERVSFLGIQLDYKPTGFLSIPPVRQIKFAPRARLATSAAQPAVPPLLPGVDPLSS